MANLKESSFWEEGIYQWETSDPVLGGENGIDNVPTRQLACRTRWLKDNKLDKTAIAESAKTAEFAKSADFSKTSGTSNIASISTKLQTSRQIGGVQFDGTSDVHLPISIGFNSKQLYQSGDLVKIDDVYYECYHPDGCKGKDPRDPVNRPAGWQNTDPSQPYYWLKIGKWLSFPEIGSPIYLPTTLIREGLIKYRNDGQLHKNKFWRLAELYPDLINKNVINIADLRAEFIRGLDDGRGVDVGRAVNSSQRYQIVDHTHSLEGWTGKGDSLISKSGPFMHNLGGIAVTQGDGGVVYSDKEGELIGSSERMLGTRGVFSGIDSGSENRPRNVAMLIATRI